jgi:hypothetical protein
MTKRRVIILGSSLGSLLVLVVALAVAVNVLSQPVEGVVNVGQPQNVSEGFNISLTPTMASDKYVSFDYPSGLMPKTDQTIQTPDVANLVFTVRDIQSWVLSVDISPNITGSATTTTAYIIRKNNPSEYHLSTLTVGSQIVPIMTDTTAPGFSQVAFLSDHNWTATVSLIGNDSSGFQPLQTSFNMVLKSWHWQS